MQNTTIHNLIFTWPIRAKYAGVAKNAFAS